jgi:ABC-type glycerol-3-phosphate transport system substrate-binding protein
MFYMSGWFVNQAVEQGIADAGKAGDYVGIFPMPIDNSGKSFAAYSPLPGFCISKDTKNADASKIVMDYLMTDYNDILCKKQGAFSTNKNIDIKYSWADGLQAEQMVEAPKPVDVTNIWQGGNVDFSGKASAVVAGKTPEFAIDEMNKSWAKGRKAAK